MRLAALRNADLHFVGALDRQRLRQQVALGDLVREQDAAWARLVVVELREEFPEHLRRAQRPIRPREVRAVTPVLSGAEKEHLDAGESAVLIGRKHIGLIDAAQVDALLRLDRRQRRETIAKHRGALEVERVGSLLHLGGQLLAHRVTAPGQKRPCFRHQLGIVGV